MSRTRSAQRAHMMRSMHAVQHPLVLRKGMRPVGYGYGYGAMTMPTGGWPCLYKGVGGQTDVVKTAAEFIKTNSGWYNKASNADMEAVDAAITDGAFTSAFKTAVTNMQRDEKYKFVDGVIGPETWGKIGPAGQNTGVNCPPAYTPSTGGGAGAGAGAGGRSAVSGGGARGTGGSITDKAWFWPVAILVPTAAVIGGILFWPKKKAQ